MQAQDQLNLKGRFTIVARDKDGNIVWQEVKDNLVVTVGKELAIERLFASAPKERIKVIGVGNSATAAAAGQTKLEGAETKLKEASKSTQSGTKQTLEVTFGTGEANFEWKELGLFNGTVNGTSVMLDRVVIGPFNKTTAVEITVTVEVTQT